MQSQSFFRTPQQRRPELRSRLCLALAGCLLAMGAMPAMAQSLTPQEREEIVEQLRQLREQQARIAEAQQKLETRLGIAGVPAASAPAPAPAPEPASPVAAATPAAMDRLTVSGDLRVRMQGDHSKPNGTSNSSQLRGRLGAAYEVNDRIGIGARLTTGDYNDPNSTDVQLSNWDDGLRVSLDLAYVQFNLGDLKLHAGKIPQPFARTDLVWDGDVNPQGISAVYKTPLDGGGAFRAGALAFPIDKRATGPESYMGGAQVGYDSPAHGPFKFDVSAGYYAYRLGNLSTADAGDWRTNRLRPGGGYLSDYRLLDVIGGLTWQGANERWPLRVTGDYVKNLGAVDDQDTGFGVDVSLGRTSRPGDWRFTYGYAQTDVDAVLAAFSNDNIGIATNYKLHSLTVDYTPMPKTMVSAIWYHYKPNDPAYAGANPPGDWLDRLRLFFLVNF